MMDPELRTQRFILRLQLQYLGRIRFLYNDDIFLRRIGVVNHRHPPDSNN